MHLHEHQWPDCVWSLVALECTNVLRDHYFCWTMTKKNENPKHFDSIYTIYFNGSCVSEKRNSTPFEERYLTIVILVGFRVHLTTDRHWPNIYVCLCLDCQLNLTLGYSHSKQILNWLTLRREYEHGTCADCFKFLKAQLLGALCGGLLITWNVGHTVFRLFNGSRSVIVKKAKTAMGVWNNEQTNDDGRLLIVRNTHDWPSAQHGYVGKVHVAKLNQKTVHKMSTDKLTVTNWLRPLGCSQWLIILSTNCHSVISQHEILRPPVKQMY